MIPPALMARLEEAWQGEVFGMAMYAAIADRQTDPYRRWQWQVMHQLEVETGEKMRQLLLRYGNTAIESTASHNAGLAEAQRIAHLPWPEMLREFAADLPPIIEEYKALERDCAFEGEDAEALRLLVEHEVVSVIFAEEERAGNSSTSLAPTLALLKNPPPQPA